MFVRLPLVVRGLLEDSPLFFCGDGRWWLGVMVEVVKGRESPYWFVGSYFPLFFVFRALIFFSKTVIFGLGPDPTPALARSGPHLATSLSTCLDETNSKWQELQQSENYR